MSSFSENGYVIIKNAIRKKTIDDLQNIVTQYMASSSFSVGISDLISDKVTNDKIVEVIKERKKDVQNLIHEVQ